MTGVRAVRGAARSRRHTSKPSMSGKLTSSTTRSSGRSPAKARAACPVSASTTSNPSLRRTRAVEYLVGALSSTTRMLARGLSGIGRSGAAAVLGAGRDAGALVGQPDRQGHGELRALAQRALDRDVAAEQQRQLSAQRQAQARAPQALLDGRIDLDEIVEQRADVLGGDADAGVGDAERDALGVTHAGGDA